METIRLGGLFDGKTKHQAGSVWDKSCVAPTIDTMQGGCREPMIIENIPCTTSRVQKGKFLGVDDLSLINVGKTEAGSVVSRYYKGIEGDHSNAVIVAMRGRNPDNPSDRTVGAPTEQRLEPNSQGICNTLTSVQKDNLVMEKVVIDDTYTNRQPRVYEDYSPALRSEREGLKTIETISTKGKQIEVASTILAGYERTNMTGFNADNGVMEVKQLGFMDNGTGKHQSNTVYDEKALCPNITTIEGGGTQQIKVMTETYSPYVNQKYEEFFKENGYIPEYFNPYNKTELTDVAPTLTAQGESVTKSSTVLKCDTQYRIRKLTPRECWRLMDFTDEDFEKAAQVNSNTQLYKQAGNSIVKNVLVAILGQMIRGKEDVYKKE